MRTRTRVFSFLLSFVMLFSLLPVTASAEEDPAAVEELLTEEPAAEPEGEPVEEPDGEPVEEPVEEPDGEPVEEPDGEPVEETAEEPAEEPGQTLIPVSFVLEDGFVLTLTGETGAIEPTASEEDSGEECGESAALYLLAPGSYTYTVRARGHRELTEAFLVSEEAGALTFTPAPEAYPFGLPGLPLDYAFSEDELAAKAAITERGVLTDLAAMTVGVDYVADELCFIAPDEQTAALYAEAYGAELASMDEGVAVVRLNGVSVADALAAAADPALLLPAAGPNAIISLHPVTEQNSPKKRLFAAAKSTAPSAWYNWYSGHFNRDPFLSDPSAQDYQYMHEVVNTFDAWSITTGISSVKVAVIDTGINSSHPEFSGRIADTGYYSTFSSAADDEGHGTHCAGIIAAAMNNGIGGAGIAPGVSIMAYKALDSEGSGTNAAVAAGIRWAANNDADIISLSLGNYFYSVPIADAIRFAIGCGSTVVVAMGNDGTNIESYPAALNIPGLIAVGATDRANARAYYSNSGSWEDVLAPGSSIYSTGNSGSDYVYASGTSMACPVVAGVCALYASRMGHKSVTPAAMEKAIKGGRTNGIVDAWKVVSKGYKPSVLSVRVLSTAADETDFCLASGTVPANFTVQLSAAENEKLLYTLDGSAPCTENGGILNGITYNGCVDFSACSVGERITVTAMAVAEDGTMGSTNQFSFTVGENVDVKALKLEGPERVNGDGTLTLKALNYRGEQISEGITWSVIAPEDADPSLEAAIDENGRLTARCVEDTELTVKAELPDGSAGYKMLQLSGTPGAYLSITGPSTLLTGKSGTYKLCFQGKATAATWRVYDKSGSNVSLGLVKVSSKGVVSVNKTAAGYTSFTLEGTAKNGLGSATIDIQVNPPVTKVTLYAADSSYGYALTYSKKGVLTGITLYSQSSSPIYPDEAHTYLGYSLTGNPSAAVTYTSSKPAVATVTPDGEIIAGAAGKTTVKVMAADGTKKYASVTVTVVNPASRISVYTTAKTMNGSSNSSGSIDTGDYYLAVGKSAKVKAVLGDDFGTPSSKKVAWYATLDVYYDGEFVTSYSASSKYFSVSSSGTVKINKSAKSVLNFYDDPDCDIILDVYARTTDGTDLCSESMLYYVVTPAVKIVDYYTGKTSRTLVLPRESESTLSYSILSESYHYTDSVIITSSNPSVAGATQDSKYYDCVDIITGRKKGKAVITVMAADGSGKKLKYTVKVY